MAFLGVLEVIGKDFGKGFGQPGRLHEIEERVHRNEQGVQRMKGMMAAFGTGLTIVHLAISYFNGKHS